jgi:hypothetical protein
MEDKALMRKRRGRGGDRIGSRMVFHLVQHDLSIGFSDNKSKFILTCMVFIIMNAMFYGACRNLSLIADAEGWMNVSPEASTITDRMAYIFQGMPVYIPSPDNPFRIPIFWAIFQILIALLVATYPANDLKHYAIHVLYRARSKMLWWNVKCVWVISTVAAFYLLCLFVAFLSTVLVGEISFAPNSEIEAIVNGLDISSVGWGELCMAMVLPLLVSATLSLLQMLLSFVLQPIVGFLIIVSYLTVSVYLSTPFLIGDYSMLLRNGLFYPEGQSSSQMFAICAVISLVTIAIGNIYFRRMDLLDNRKDSD